MMNWQKQLQKPLFEDLMWSKPERKSQAGKLLIVGGNKYEFARAQECHRIATDVGIGEIKVVLPRPLEKLVGKQEDIFYLPATEGGSFSDSGYEELLGFADWADGVLIAGEISRNSETTLMLQKFAANWQGKLVLTHDALDQLANDASIAERESTTLIGGLGQFQRLAPAIGSATPIRLGDNLENLVAAVAEVNKLTKHCWIATHENWISCFLEDQIISTNCSTAPHEWRSVLAATFTVHWVQNPSKQLAAGAISAFEYAHPGYSGKSAA